MSAPAKFVVVEELARGAGAMHFVRNVAQRITWRAVLIVLAIFIGWDELTRTAFYPAIVSPTAPPELRVSFLVIDVIAAAWFIVGLRMGDELVARGNSTFGAYALATVLSAFGTAAMQWYVRDWLHLRVLTSLEETLVRVTQPALVFFEVLIQGGLMTAVYVNAVTARKADARRRAAELERANTARRTLESRLQAMQARVEPQFLFNTLGQVKVLFEKDATLARRTLDDLITYLRAALPHLRETTSTAAKELELARAYLSIAQVRLGPALAFDMSASDAAGGARLPSMMLLPLVDHVLAAIGAHDAPRHAAIDAQVGAGTLRIAVSDSGGAFREDRTGASVHDIQERLRALYDDRGGLDIDASGTRATLRIPHDAA